MESEVKFYAGTAKLINEFKDFSESFRENIYAKMYASSDRILIYYKDYDDKEYHISAEDFFNNIDDIMRVLRRITRIKEDIEEKDVMMI